MEGMDGHRQDVGVIEATLRTLRCPGRIVQVQDGPRLVRYGLLPADGVRMRTLAGLAPDLARVLAVQSVHVWAPVPGTMLVGIDVPRREPRRVLLGEVLRPTWDGCYPPLTLPIGLDVVGEPVLADLAQMPHLLIAGSTGSGKSTMLHAMIAGLALRNSPQDLRMVLVDRKGTELVSWGRAPHVLAPVLRDMDEIATTLRWLNDDVLDGRARRFASEGVRTIWEHNVGLSGPQRMPVWVLIVDELGDLMAVATHEVRDDLTRLAALGRAVGLHLLLSTQRPSVDVVAGVIKANLPARIACRLPTASDSRVVLDQGGAEDLLGDGDALFLAPDGHLTRVQGALVRSQDIAVVARHWPQTSLVPTYLT